VTINTVAPTYQTELQYSGAGGWFLTGWERYVYDGWNQILTVHMEDNGTTVRGRVSTNVWGPDLASLPYDRQTWQAAGGVAGLVLIRDGVSTFTGHAGWSAPTDPTDDDYFLFHDHLGNVTGYRKAVVGVAVGAMAAIYEYDAFGRELRASYDAVGSPNVKNMPYRFSTKFTDVESGCVYYGYRIYDPTKGRWLNRDPILERGHFALHQLKKTVPAKARMLAGHNNYSFIFNRPISAVDPDGRFPLILVPIVAGGGAGAICAWGCQGRVNSALSAAEKEADANAPDGTTHRNPRVDIGGDADALTHCIAGCKLAKFWWPCHGPDDALAELQKRENKPGDDSTMDRNNNAAGVGLGNGIGTGQLGYPGQTCLEGCLGLLRGGDLSELNYTEPPSEVIPSS
jgi:RHS repeat-associated protein